MKIAFIFKTITISSPLGMMYLSAALKKAGHKTTLICFKKENLFKKLKEFKPEVIAYSLTTGSHKDYISINKKIKKYFKVYSIFGGPHPTFYPEMIKEKGVDAICRGEGEEAFVEFINKLEKGQDITKVKNFWIKNNNKIFKNPIRNLIQDLDKILFPDRDVVYKKNKFFLDLKIKRFITSRGCPFKCTFCFNRHYNELYKNKGPIVRHRSVNNVLKEIKEVKRRYPLKVVKFIDDTFNLNKKWLKEFCEKYKKEINLPFVCNVRPDLVTPEIVKQLKKANCIVVYIGIESGNENIRKKILERNISNKQILTACKLLKKQGIKIVSQNMLGIPGDTLKDSFKTIFFNSKCKPDFPGFSIFQPYPKTILANYAIKNGFFDGNFDNVGASYLSYTVLNYKKSEKRQLENLYKLSTMTAKFPFLYPLVKILIKFPKNKIYDFIYMVFYGLSQWKIYSIITGSYLESVKFMKKISEFLFET